MVFSSQTVNRIKGANVSALIRHFVVHQLAINDQQQLTLVPRNSCFSVTPEIEDLAQQINHAFNTKRC